MDQQTAPLDNKPSRRLPSTRSTILLIFGVLFLGVAIVMGLPQVRNDQNRDTAGDPSPTASPDKFVANGTILYGTWDGTNSNVYAYDLSSSKHYEVAKLPIDIKKIMILDNNRLLFINQTKKGTDHGKEIAIFYTKSGELATVYQASDGYGVDDFVLSPNKQYIGVWEMQLSQDGTVEGGKSRVYTANISSAGTKNLIYDESVTPETAVHYPTAIMNDGRIFMDTFYGNKTVGHSSGMSVANFDGSNKQDIESMKEGTYGTQPYLSTDGTQLVFGGYDGTRGGGSSVRNDYRQAILTPNTVEFLNTSTLERTKIEDLPNSNVYSVVKWDNLPNKLLLYVQAPTRDKSGTHTFDLTTNVLTKHIVSTEVAYIESLPDGEILYGAPITGDSGLSNLGEFYAPSYLNFSLFSPQTQTSLSLEIREQVMQFIGIEPSKSFANARLVSATNSRENLHLQAFYFKTELAPTREVQQTISTGNCRRPQSLRGLNDPNVNNQDESLPECPRCRDLAAAQCGEVAPKSANLQQGSDCYVDAFRAAQSSRSCYDSPLYLYGPEGLEVSVKVHTEVSNSTPAYNNGYKVRLNGDGTFDTNGYTYDSITFDYKNALRRLEIPARGKVVPIASLESTVREYAQKLALNEKETEDLLKTAKKMNYGPYVYVSFFDHQTSNMILPMTFSPEPDVYRNIVFYFRNLTNDPRVNFEEPVFEPIRRTGFTAVEISEIVE